jgi:hypothetical protein
MFRAFSCFDWLPFWRLAAVMTITLTVAGCANLDLRGDGFTKDEAFDSAGQYRANDSHADLFGFSNKARQIERNCGAR